VHTEADARVLFTNILTLVVGEEHVGRKTTLGCVGVCERERGIVSSKVLSQVLKGEMTIPFFFFSTPRVLVLVVALALDLGMALVVAFDLESAAALEAFGGILSRWHRR